MLDEYDELEKMIGSESNSENVEMEIEPEPIFPEEFVQTGELNYQEPSTVAINAEDDIKSTIEEMYKIQASHMGSFEDYLDTLTREEADQLRKYAIEKGIYNNTVLEQKLMLQHAKVPQAELLIRLEDQLEQRLFDTSVRFSNIIKNGIENNARAVIADISKEFQKGSSSIKNLSKTLNNIGQNFENGEKKREETALEHYAQIKEEMKTMLAGEMKQTNNEFRNELLAPVKKDVGEIKTYITDGAKQAFDAILGKIVPNFYLKMFLVVASACCFGGIAAILICKISGLIQ
ncbi:hypothetical protein [Burkholderia cenocepacia]|uniref:hypothetical protein n=1 Tax=Burkholderia cenocepacia TaxID=95486 RepID=UPI0011785976|nr:hypothetical protein [Burkholderia cenocepacia]MCW5156312.1 hypothetical protein [Burkholderia cenocepacia]